MLRGNIPTDEIILRAQKTNDIVNLDRWSIANAINSIPKLDPDQKLYINCHPKTLRLTNDLINYDTIQKSSILPEQIVIEITEHEFLELRTFWYHKKKLNEIGIKIAIDDFGKNISDLQYLINLKPDIVKLDKLFAQEIFDPLPQKYIKEIVQLHNKLNFEIVAEGIENHNQKSMYEMLGIEYGQGWLFGKAQPEIDKQKYINI